MGNDVLELLSAVNGLSREKDGVSLTRVLIHTLRALSPGIAVSVIEVYGHRSIDRFVSSTSRHDFCLRRFDETGHRLHTHDSLEDLRDVCKSLHPVTADSAQEGTRRLLIPLEGESGPLRLVILEKLPIDNELRANVLQIVEIYGNLIRLLDGRERDALTGLLNRQLFASLFDLARARAQEMAAGVTLAMLDIDRFKQVNEKLGHLFGDEVLIHFARLVERSFRYTDDLFRFGGGQFVVLLASARPDDPYSVLDRFRKIVERHEFPGVHRVTVSIGFVRCRDNALPTTQIDWADRALNAAKANGRNRVVDFDALGEPARHIAGTIQLF